MTRQETKTTVLNFLLLPAILLVTIGVFLLVVYICEAIPDTSARTDDLGGGGAGIAILGGLISFLFLVPAFVWWNSRLIKTIRRFKTGKITKGLNIGILMLPYVAIAMAFVPPLIKDQINASKSRAQTIETKVLELSPASVEYSNIISLDSLQKVSPFLETRYDYRNTALSVLNSSENPDEYFEKIFGYLTSTPTQDYYYFDLEDGIYFRVVFPCIWKEEHRKYLHIAAFSKKSFVYKINLDDCKLGADFFGFHPAMFCHKGNFYIIWKTRVFKFPVVK